MAWSVSLSAELCSFKLQLKFLSNICIDIINNLMLVPSVRIYVFTYVCSCILPDQLMLSACFATCVSRCERIH